MARKKTTRLRSQETYSVATLSCMTSFLILDSPISTQIMLIGSLLGFELAHKIADFLHLAVGHHSCDCSKELLECNTSLYPSHGFDCLYSLQLSYSLLVVGSRHSCCRSFLTVSSRTVKTLSCCWCNWLCHRLSQTGC